MNVSAEKNGQIGLVFVFHVFFELLRVTLSYFEFLSLFGLERDCASEASRRNAGQPKALGNGYHAI